MIETFLLIHFIHYAEKSLKLNNLIKFRLIRVILIMIVTSSAVAVFATTLTLPKAVAIFFKAVAFFTITHIIRELWGRQFSRKGIWIFYNDLIYSFWTLHIICLILTGLAEACLDKTICTSSHIRPTEKHAQYILRQRLLLQLQPVYLLMLLLSHKSKFKKRVDVFVLRCLSSTFWEESFWGVTTFI